VANSVLFHRIAYWIISRCFREMCYDELFYYGESVDLLVCSPGHCASHSLKKYIEFHNPKLKVKFSQHTGAAVVSALKKGILCVVISRDSLDLTRSICMSKHKNRRFHNIKFYEVLAKSGLTCPVVHFREVVNRPAFAVLLINAHYRDLNLRLGDDKPFNICTYEE